MEPPEPLIVDGDELEGFVDGSRKLLFVVRSTSLPRASASVRASAVATDDGAVSAESANRATKKCKRRNTMIVDLLDYHT
ncbi:MAG: hypothetical protein AAGD43_10315 [Pseudomonadota bacterium]